MSTENEVKKRNTIAHRINKMVSTGIIDDPINQGYDVLSTSALVINLLEGILITFDPIRTQYLHILQTVESVTVFIFAVDYVLRIIAATDMYPDLSPLKAIKKYVLSFYGIIDLLSFLPFYLPVVFPGGLATFRMIRVVRILRLFRINAYYDSLNVISEVMILKRQQLLASVFIIGTLMLGSSLCMYSLEHEAQPEVFSNAFSGLWWSASTLLTVGYGDIYPITPMGRFMGVIIAFLGVGIVAIPTGIISAGFVEHYSKLKRFGEYSEGHSILFAEFSIEAKDTWCGKRVRELSLPKSCLIAVIKRRGQKILPRSDTMIVAGDKLVIGTGRSDDLNQSEFTELTLGKDHPWKGMAIRNLDISRESLIVMIKRNQKTTIPRADLVLLEGDTLYIYSQSNNV